MGESRLRGCFAARRSVLQGLGCCMLPWDRLVPAPLGLCLGRGSLRCCGGCWSCWLSLFSYTPCAEAGPRSGFIGCAAGALAALASFLDPCVTAALCKRKKPQNSRQGESSAQVGLWECGSEWCLLSFWLLIFLRFLMFCCKMLFRLAGARYLTDFRVLCFSSVNS